ncbi:hypothetical protein SEMRO_1452_G273960.1 [Seminavis robusta]|uniref:Uncharacterized protein n=1 Tax=Seminavis robusta TaxID=568900 RepID=A0A9N8EM59_9STRA|nr:hypothetical protein SEMRO_1452_G273960.1 [Seminavis robusta]|eukprot:Sro1452_g273960.1 n/a (165) ;mRNA; r:28242-28736
MISTIRRDLMKLPPIVMQRKDSYGSLETVKDCNVPCKVSMDTCAIADNDNAKGEVCLPDISDWTVEGTDFHFRYSWLDPRLNPQEVAISRKAYRENYFYVTRSFQSEIPLSAFDWDRYGEMKNARADLSFTPPGPAAWPFIRQPVSGPSNTAGGRARPGGLRTP